MIKLCQGKNELVCLSRPKFRNYSIMAFALGMVSGAALYHLIALLIVVGVQP